MALQDVTDAIEAELKKLVPEVAVQFGPEHLAALAAPPRVLFIPTNSDFSGPAPHWADAEPRAIHTEDAELHAIVWGADHRAMEGLRNQLILATRSAVGPNYRLGRAENLVQEANALTICGRACRLPITFAMPVLAEPTGIAEVTDVEASTAPTLTTGT